MKKKVLILERFSPKALAHLKSHEDSIEVLQRAQTKPNESEKKEAFALIIRSKTRVNAHFLKDYPNLKLIVSATSGFDHIDWKLTQEKGIHATYCPNGNAQSAAEHTWALLLACSRKLPLSMENIKQGNWDRSQLLGTELSGKTLGIVGLGRVGQKVAHFAKAFGMSVQYYDPYLSAAEKEKYPFAESMSLIEVFRSSDVISFHCPGTSETRHLLNHQTTEHFCNSPIIINAARGSVVHEEALLIALEQERVSMAGLDTFNSEPLRLDSRLLGHPQCVLTPHIGATTNEALNKVSMEASQKVLDFLARGSTSESLPQEIPWLGDVEA